ncbi:hypothetical protein [Candidatus Electronema sp. JC]|uniref:hypothetical protein n=1 Tax=Candidatus Electronema sp. JC TaxID=3401570 RepID=UPI003AA808AA
MFEWKYVVPAITGIFGIIIGHILLTHREDQKRKKEIRIEYLIEAFRKLERGSTPVAGAYRSEDFESAIADIQLLGETNQVQLAHQFCVAASSGDGSLLQNLLEDLREQLRTELKLGHKELPPIRPFRLKQIKTNK